ncbi:hypothetical protein SPRG_19693 [Saprolegnia parasitica CBS 223.65]|uniref:Uncharacterized protein n=1 Tax=Saprolegnia parasitica (strain CBS 223.65) TaxID=695850 RepID=A0A067CKR9_SAPPC|nr:hypothetical protein SPRG_19693 [Saprolegnia parasitica CBS 223.65]KDO29780.1 hypothetical protein SPRG_19693 [Saprolegnia parasitica CBS 223.65]|eukprot:XP_012199518.1 hypothetical protein SPRG_19693 [Saprolegnia parasitica CBS 223.65]
MTLSDVEGTCPGTFLVGAVCSASLSSVVQWLEIDTALHPRVDETPSCPRSLPLVLTRIPLRGLSWLKYGRAIDIDSLDGSNQIALGLSERPRQRIGSDFTV